MSATIFYHKLIVVSENNGERKILYLFSLYLFAQFTVSESLQNRTNILYLTTEILYPKTENVNIQTKLKPVWFGLFPIL